MQGRDLRDILSGLGFILLGLGAASYAYVWLRLGTFRAMGPGMFPLLVGLAMAGFGLCVFIPALRRRVPRQTGLWSDLRPAAAVLASICVFAATMRVLGLIPASLLMVLVSLLASPGRGLAEVARALLLALVISAIAWLIFVRGLGVALDPWRWPF